MWYLYTYESLSLVAAAAPSHVGGCDLVTGAAEAVQPTLSNIALSSDIKPFTNRLFKLIATPIVSLANILQRDDTASPVVLNIPPAHLI